MATPCHTNESVDVLIDRFMSLNFNHVSVCTKFSSLLIFAMIHIVEAVLFIKKCSCDCLNTMSPVGQSGLIRTAYTSLK